MKHYRLYIKDRDKQTCFLCGSKKRLEVHHIDKKRSNNHSNNLITLCYNCHRFKVHLRDYRLFKPAFYEYTSQFTEPEDWQDIIIYSIREDKDRYKRSIQNKDLESDRTARKNYRKYLKLKFMEENGGLTPSQVAYRKQKEYLSKKSIEKY